MDGIRTRWNAYRSWLEARVDFDDAMATPVRVLWVDLTWYCREHGFQCPSAEEFADFLACEERIRFKEGGRGLVRRFALGAHLRQERRAA